jgi:hypothetical protein
MRFGNAVYRWQPDFKHGGYREGLVSESPSHVTLEFYTPYIIGATPPNQSSWGIYDSGCKNGLVLFGSANCRVAVSNDGGSSWKDAGLFHHGMDLTDFVKGHRQYHLRLETGSAELAESGIVIQTVCQLNPAVLPRLKDHGTAIEFSSGGRAIVSFGPNKQQASPKIVAGAFDTPRVTMEIETPRGEAILELYVSAHMASSNPPNPEVKYELEYSLDQGKSWHSLLNHSSFERRVVEPDDFWSQSLWSGSKRLSGTDTRRVQVRIRNDGGKRVMRAECHLVYAANQKAAEVTYAWRNDAGDQSKTHQMNHGETWSLETGKDVSTRWVEIR